ncbi:MAG TPA: hypothetical protein V6C52_13080 [Coleofasciculaceae cyanobacterium]
MLTRSYQPIAVGIRFGKVQATPTDEPPKSPLQKTTKSLPAADSNTRKILKGFLKPFLRRTTSNVSPTQARIQKKPYKKLTDAEIEKRTDKVMTRFVDPFFANLGQELSDCGFGYACKHITRKIPMPVDPVAAFRLLRHVVVKREKPSLGQVIDLAPANSLPLVLVKAAGRAILDGNPSTKHHQEAMQSNNPFQPEAGPKPKAP